MQTNDQIMLTILAGTDGGLIVYETLESENRLVFGGNLDEVSAYLHQRMDRLGLKETIPGEPQAHVVIPTTAKPAPVSLKKLSIGPTVDVTALASDMSYTDYRKAVE